MRFLIIDDDPDDIEIFRDAVQQINPSHQCLEARDGEQAWQLLLKEPSPPDYIFADMNMPVMNGKEFLIHVKNSIRFKNLQVIIYTTSDSYEEHQALKKLGAREVLTKPSSFNRLIQSICILTNQRTSKA
jgi:CheY-like chemotaxis protein